MNWPEISILFIAALVGSIAIMPYSLRLLRNSPQKKPLKLSLSTLVLISILQNAVLSAIILIVGLSTAHAIGLGAPYIESALSGVSLMPPFLHVLYISAVTGILAGLILFIADIFFLPYWPQRLWETTLQTTTWENFTASFYGGINEELLMRLFGFSLLVWLISFFSHPNLIIFWIVNSIMTLVFGLGHLPALKKLLGSLSRVMITRSLLLNAPIGLLCGWLFWTYGIEAAMVAHFLADIVYHVVGTIILRLKKKHRFISQTR